MTEPEHTITIHVSRSDFIDILSAAVRQSGGKTAYLDQAIAEICRQYLELRKAKREAEKDKP